MKKIPSKFLIIFTLPSLFLYSCATKKTGFFSNNYERYSPSAKTVPMDASASVEEAIAPLPATTVLETAEAMKPATLEPTKKAKVATTTTAVENILLDNNTKPTAKKLTKEEKREVREALSSTKARTGIGTLILVILAILLPPLAVALVDGLTGPFWLSLLLTLLFYVPGLIYALWRVFRAD